MKSAGFDMQHFFHINPYVYVYAFCSCLAALIHLGRLSVKITHLLLGGNKLWKQLS